MGNVDDGQIPDRGSVTRDQALAMWRREFGYRSTDIPMSDNQLRRYGYDPDKATRS